MTKKGDIILQIRCHADVKLAFKVLAARMDENYEETLKRLMKMEKEHPLEKKEKGVTVRL